MITRRALLWLVLLTLAWGRPTYTTYLPIAATAVTRWNRAAWDGFTWG